MSVRTPYCIQITCCVHDIINRSKDTITRTSTQNCSSLSLILKDTRTRRIEEEGFQVGYCADLPFCFVIFALLRNFEVFKSTIQNPARQLILYILYNTVARHDIHSDLTLYQKLRA